MLLALTSWFWGTEKVGVTGVTVVQVGGSLFVQVGGFSLVSFSLSLSTCSCFVLKRLGGVR